MACGATLSFKRSLEFDPVHDPSVERSAKRRRCMPGTMSGAVPPTKQHQINRSIFTPVSSRITNEQIAAHISAQVKWMQKRRQLGCVLPASCDENCDSSSAASSSSSEILRRQTPLTPRHGGGGSACRDVPMFTQQQIGLVCERMIREREGQLKDEYEQVLSSKLAEQYDAFLMFNKYELNRQHKEAAASYIS